MDSLLELFCDADDFCQKFEPAWKKRYWSVIRACRIHSIGAHPIECFPAFMMSVMDASLDFSSTLIEYRGN